MSIKIIVREVETSSEIGEKSVHCLFKFVIILGQLAGFFPITNVLTSKISEIKFSWFSWKTVTSLLICAVCIVNVAGQIKYIWTHGYSKKAIDDLFFWTSGATSCYLFIILAKNWAFLMEEWYIVQEAMHFYEKRKSKTKLLVGLTVIFVLLQTVEHVSLQIYKVLKATNCKTTFMEVFDFYVEKITFYQVFDMIPYTSFVGFLFLIINYRISFLWTYMDLVIMLISICLAERYEMVAEKVKQMTLFKVHCKNSWRSSREDYFRVNKLCGSINKNIGNMVLVSFAINIYFIIMQLYDSLHPSPDILETFYFYFSFGLLVLRTVSLCYFLGKVHEAAAKPLHFLSALPHYLHNAEIERFIDAVSYDVPSISGNDYFIVTKSSIMKIAEAIVTYELMLIRFNAEAFQDVSLEGFTC